MISKKGLLQLIITLFAAGSFSSLFAVSSLPNCAAGTVGSYITSTQNPPASGGCAIGVLDYYNFAYTAGTNAPAPSSINVALSTSGFSFGPVSAAPNQTVQFEIDYDIFIDPAPIITGDSLGLDIDGNVSVTEYFCNDLPLNVGTGLNQGGATCLGSVPASDSLTVDNNSVADRTNSVTFATPVTKFQEVAIVFTLNGGANGSFFPGS